MDVLQIVTPWIVGIGAGLGLYHTGVQIRAKATRFKVECQRYMVPHPNMQFEESVLIKVTNLSSFPIEIVIVAFFTSEKIQIIPNPSRANLGDGTHKRLERGEQMTTHYAPGFYDFEGVNKIKNCFAETSTGHRRKGNIKALNDYLKHVERS